MSKLTLETIRKYSVSERTHKPDWDDTAINFTFPNNIDLTCLTVCCNNIVDDLSLEGVDGFIYIETVEDLELFVSKSCDEVLNGIYDKDKRFKIDEWR